MIHRSTRVPVGLVSLVMLSFSPTIAAIAQIPTSNSSVASSSAPHIDNMALELLKENRDTMLRLTTYAAECRTTTSRPHLLPHQHGQDHRLSFLAAAKPNRMHFEMWDLPETTEVIQWRKPAVTPTFISNCDGREWVKQLGGSYATSDIVQPEAIHALNEPWSGFWSAGSSPFGMVTKDQQSGSLLSLTIVGNRTINGLDCVAICESTRSSLGDVPAEGKSTWYLRPDHLVQGGTYHFVYKQAESNYTFDIRQIVINRPLSAARFAYVPAPGIVPSMAIQDDASLLKAGTIAPDFTARDDQNRPVKLSDFRGKTVIVDFWGSWCHNCVEAMPGHQALVKRLRARGVSVVLLAVDDTEARDKFDAWVRSNGTKYPDLTFVHLAENDSVSGKQYKVSAYPTEYVVDPGGAIRTTFIGWEKGDALGEAVVK